MEGHSAEVLSVAISSDGKTIVSAGSDEKSIWRVGKRPIFSSRTSFTSLVPHFHMTTHIEIIEEWRPCCRIWDTESVKENVKLEGHQDTVRSVAISANCKIIIYGSNDTTIR